YPGARRGLVLRDGLRRPSAGPRRRGVAHPPAEGAHVRGRAATVQAAVAAGALALAAWTWLSPPAPVVAGSVPAAAVQPGAGAAVRYDDGSHAVDVLRNVPGAPAVRVRVARSPSLSAPDGGPRPDGGTPGAATRPGDGGVPRPDGGIGGRLDGGVVRLRDGGVEPLLQALREAPPPPDREFRGNETAEQLPARVAPLLATRDLGRPVPDRLEQMG